MNRFILIILLYPVLLFGQSDQSEHYLKLYERYREEKKPDSVVVVCQQLMQTDKHLAKEQHLDYYMAIAAFEAKNYELAIHQSKKLIPNIYFKSQAHWNRKCFEKNMRCHTLCSDLADYYDQTGNVKKEYKYLSLMLYKFNCVFCGTGRSAWYERVYKELIKCSNELGKTNRAKRLERELEEWTKNRISTNF